MTYIKAWAATLLVASTTACLLTPKDFEKVEAIGPSSEMPPEVYNRRFWLVKCGSGALEKREACVQAFEVAHRKKTNR